MPALVAFLFAALRIFMIANLVGFAVRLLAAFGLYFLVVEPTTDVVMDVLTNRFNIIPGVAADWIGYLKVDVYVGMIMSAFGIVQVSNIVLRKR